MRYFNRALLVVLLLAGTVSAQWKHNFTSGKSDTSDATLVRASDWNAFLIPVPESTVFVSDEFIGGGTATGTIGSLGWSFTTTGGGLGIIAAVADHPGIDSIGIAATANNYYALRLASPAQLGCPILTPCDFEVVFIVRLAQDSTDNNLVARFGVIDSSVAPAAGALAANGIYFERLAADNSWFGVTRNGDTESRTAALGDARNTWYRLKIRYNNDTQDSVGFTIGDGSEVMAAVANIPTADPLMPYAFIYNNNNASVKQMYIDYFHVKITGLVR